MAFPMPELEGKYEVLEKIREGGMGAIYKVRHRLLHEVRVIKVMRPSLGQNDELCAVDRFIREARIAIKLRHPNIAQLYDFSSDESGNGFIVMEFIDGLNLDDVLHHSGPPSVGLAVEIATQSLEALGALHEAGFVHRDISPDNLMLTRDLRGRSLVKLIDLGIAKLVQNDDAEGVTKTGTFLGKYKYAPPEMFQDASGSGIDRRSDLYSFGIVLYKFLTNEHPITGSDVSSVIAGHLFRDPLSFDESDPERKVPESLRQIVLKALAKKPDDRYQDAEEMVEALEAVHKEVGLSENPDEVQALIDLRDRLRAEAAAKPGTGTQAGIDDLFPAGSTEIPADQGTGGATVIMEATNQDGANPAAQTASEADSDVLRAGENGLMKTPNGGVQQTGLSATSADLAQTAHGQAAAVQTAAAPAKKFNPLVAVAAVFGGLLLILAVVLATRGGDGEALPEENSAGVGAVAADGDQEGTQASAVAVASDSDPVADLVASAVAALDVGDWELLGEKLAEIDEVLDGERGAEQPTLSPDVATQIAVLRDQLLQQKVMRVADALQTAIAKGDRSTLDSILNQLSPQEERALVVDADRAAVLTSARSASVAMARFESALASSDPAEALTIAFELVQSQPDIARSINAKERAARNAEERIDRLVGAGELRAAREAAEALRRVWPDRPRLRARFQRIARMSNAAQTGQGVFQEAEMTIAAGEPHVGLQMLENRKIPVPFRDRVERLRARLREDLSRRDRREPQFLPFDERQDVDFEKGNPAVIQMKVSDDYMVVGVQARARNEKGEETTIAAVPMGEGVYRVTVPQQFHGDEAFRFWALAVDQSKNEGRFGASNRPIEIRRKGLFLRRRG